ncbi:MAG: outer membrane lipoprotein-sorting protein [Rhizobiales bacterium]|nr:outer membrane lipoprotein-sorting protein [Hyphomicrobiales bacterium]
MFNNLSAKRHARLALVVGFAMAGLCDVAGAADLPPPSDPAARGLAIARLADEMDAGWHDASADMKMILKNANGETSERELRFLMLEITKPDEGDWSLMVFSKPRDISGTALLTYAHVKEPDEQWLYLPAIKRVKRISSANKSGPFVGSEFAFEDLATQEVGKFTYEWLRDEPCGALTCHVVERRPAYENSGYTRQIVWTDTTNYKERKIEYYDRKNALLKTLTYEDYALYNAKFWRPSKLAMVNHENGKSTELIWESYMFQSGLTENDFTTSSLERAR